MKSLPCPPDRWPDFSRLLDAAMALPADQRGAWLKGLQREDAQLRPFLQAVLHGLTAAAPADFLAAPKWPSDPEHEQGLQSGQRVGPYELIRELGRGGMGVVWLARRCDGAYERDVALKLPHLHLLAGVVRDRFLRERDFLATLSHPNIARFYDAGLADDGRPYLALEAVQGEPITRWAQERALGISARLALFMQVLAAVEHAHGKLIAHRDLKPANVLVSAEGEVRLLDFGIAKLLSPEASSDRTAALTRAEHRLATPAYAAPEQIAGEPVTAATDVYALGTLLYELLTGQPPFGTQGPSAGLRAALDSAARSPANDEARLASEQVGSTHAQTVGLTRRALARALSGDLDAVLAKALQREPAQRYATVGALADDLGRCAQGRPIAARRITAWLRAGKFVRRHRLGVAMASLLAGSVAAGVAGVAWQSQQAQAQARRAGAVKDFLLGVFAASDPRIASDTPRGQITAKALLDASAGKIEARFKDDPEVQIELLRTVADIYRELGEDDAYDSYQARQIELARKYFGSLHENVLSSRMDAIEHAARINDTARCRRLLDELDPVLHEAGSDDDVLRARWLAQRSACLADVPGAAQRREGAIQQSLQLFERKAPRTRWHVSALAELAATHSYAMRNAEAVAANRQAISLAESMVDHNDAELQSLYANLGTSLTQLGDLAGAEAAFDRATQLAVQTTGAHFRTAWVPAGRRARTAHLLGARERAERLFSEVLAVIPPPEAQDAEAETVREAYGERLAAEGRPLEAIAVLEAVERTWLAKSPSDFALRRVRRHLGDAYARAGRLDAARSSLQRSLDDYEQQGQPGSQPVIAIRERMGRFLLDGGDLQAARSQFERTVHDAADPMWSTVALAQAGLARTALAQDDLSAAQAHSDQALSIWSQVTGFKDMRMEPYLWRVRAAVVERAGDSAAAAALRTRALEASRRYDAPDSPTVRDPRYMGL